MNSLAMVNAVVDWMNEKVCPNLLLKKASENMKSTERIHPTAFPMFIPENSMLPDGVESGIPGFAVQIKKGRDVFEDGYHQTIIDARILCVIWNPGLDPDSIFYPKESEKSLFNVAYKKKDASEFKRDLVTGLNEVISVMDTVKYELIKAEPFNGVRLLYPENSIEFGFFKDGETFLHNAPYFLTYIDCSFASDNTIQRDITSALVNF